MEQPTPNPVSPPDDLARWIAAPAVAFDRWLAQPTCSVSPKLLAASSKHIYRTMWHKFALWLQNNGLRLDQVKAHHIEVFLEKACPNKVRRNAPAPLPAAVPLVGQQGTHSLSEEALAKGEGSSSSPSQPHKKRTEHRQRYVRLIERTYDYLRDELGLNWLNPGREAALSKMGAGQNAPMQFLEAAACQAIFNAIHRFLEQSIPTEVDPDSIEWARQWGAARDMALVGTLVGTGLRVEEVHRLSVNCTLLRNSNPEVAEVFPDCLQVPGRPGDQGRKALCLPFVRQCLTSWLHWRALMPWATQCDALFPADIRMRRSEHQGKSEAMHPATLFRAVSRVLNFYGITGARVGAQTLRNTYAALLLEVGCSDHLLMETLGLKSPLSVFRLREYFQPPPAEKSPN